MLPHKQVGKFLIILFLFGEFFLYSFDMRVCFLTLRCIFILIIAIVFYQSHLFWDCANGFVNIFSVCNDFNATNNFIRFLNFTYSFVEVNVDVSYDVNRNFSELIK